MRHKGITGLLIVATILSLIGEINAQSIEQPKRLYVLLSASAEAPTPRQIVEWDLVSKPPTHGLGSGSPTGGYYLIPIRAEGDFKQRLDAHPQTPRAKLERYVVIEYPESTNLSSVIDALVVDPNIDAVQQPQPLAFSGVSLADYGIAPELAPIGSGSAGYERDAMNINRAWQWAGGYGLIGIPDTGLSTQHPELRSFTNTGTFTHGNFLPAYSLDVGLWTAIDTNVDERQPEPPMNLSSACPTDPNGLAPIDYVGHGTHVAGQAAANAYDGNSVKGTCKNCGVGLFRIVYARCEPGFGVVPEMSYEGAAAAITLLSDVGAQVITQSFGNPDAEHTFCTDEPNDPICLAIAYATPRDIVLAAASGNNRQSLQFPASDSRVVSVGGFDQTLQLWNDDRDPPPNQRDDCPFPGFDNECGSSYTTSLSPSERKQEVVGAAKQAFGAIYAGFNWNLDVGCGDGFGGGTTNDGYGECTGTSMSSPQVAGILGILRSVNPLVKVGNPEVPSVIGVRNVLASTTFQAQAGIPWGQQLGYGRPDAEAAVRRMLGKTAGVTVRNRATPMFGFYGSASKDYSYTTSPNTAIAFLINGSANSVPSGNLIPAYPSFPPDPLLGAGDTPRASAYVMTTEYKTNPAYPDLVPLYMMERTRHYPVGCNPSLPSCNTNNRDFLMATGQAEIQALYAAGYTYRGINGYVYQRCTPEPSCIPAGAEKLWRKCKTADDDCAIFLENQRVTFEGNGYTATVPSGYPQHIGYAYPTTDSDSDGLIDGFERLIGTSPAIADTDGDGVSDGNEFPLAGVSVRDPCDGPQSHRCPADYLFADDFEL